MLCFFPGACPVPQCILLFPLFCTPKTVPHTFCHPFSPFSVHVPNASLALLFSYPCSFLIAFMSTLGSRASAHPPYFPLSRSQMFRFSFFHLFDIARPVPSFVTLEYCQIFSPPLVFYCSVPHPGGCFSFCSSIIRWGCPAYTDSDSQVPWNHFPVSYFLSIRDFRESGSMPLGWLLCWP